ncbi:hypothetical protein WI94_04825 [Burkholderia vietnamiensis]|nr:hypothetical protein WI94_04825 [Burkholderia vietnamiensis]KVE88588.1 hypothetical protein WJ00_08690 [Burkholderia vietnamiensis]
MLAQFRMADILRQAPVEMCFAFVFLRQSLQFVEQSGRQATINDVVCQSPKILRTKFWIFGRIFQTAEAEQFLVVIRRKRANVGLQFLGYEFLKNLRKRIARSVFLITSGFINEGNDANSCEAANEHFALFGDVQLLWLKRTCASRGENHLANIGKDRRGIAIDGNSPVGSEKHNGALDRRH